MLLDLLRRLLWGERETVRTRLSSDEAIAIAREAARDDPMAEELEMTYVDVRSGTPVWIVRVPGVGANLVVQIDDATGRILEVTRVSGR